ncbi:hypothetical protein ERO13_D11G241101v2 [Gossypium hirsutum]|nr:hypothetical protein ERO13_D11G241101v2 [Gossypium hirsutum]
MPQAPILLQLSLSHSLCGNHHNLVQEKLKRYNSHN